MSGNISSGIIAPAIVQAHVTKSELNRVLVNDPENSRPHIHKAFPSPLQYLMITSIPFILTNNMILLQAKQ